MFEPMLLVPGEDLTPGTVTALSSGPYANIYYSGAGVGDYIYIFGGRPPSLALGTNIFYRYHIPSDTWQIITNDTNRPKGVEEAAVVVWGGKLYFYGGRFNSGGSLTYTNQLLCYDPVANDWSVKTPYANNSDSKAAVVIGNKMYACGVNVTGTNLLCVFDFVTETWSNLGACPFQAKDVNFFTYNGDLYSFGGYGYGSTTQSYLGAWKYSLTTNTWTALANMPAPRLYSALFDQAGKLYFYGGQNGAQPGVLEYDIAANTYNVLLPDLYPRLSGMVFYRYGVKLIMTSSTVKTSSTATAVTTPQTYQYIIPT